MLLAPFIASVTSLYTIMCFNNSTSYMMVIGVNIIAVIVWLVCLIYKEERKLAPVMRNNKILFFRLIASSSGFVFYYTQLYFKYNFIKLILPPF